MRYVHLTPLDQESTACVAPQPPQMLLLGGCWRRVQGLSVRILPLRVDLVYLLVAFVGLDYDQWESGAAFLPAFPDA